MGIVRMRQYAKSEALISPHHKPRESTAGGHKAKAAKQNVGEHQIYVLLSWR